MFTPKTIIEPFRIKTVESLPITTRDQRCEALQLANYNLFSIAADKVTIDLMTDSGTSAMSDSQWAGMMRGDESYAGGRSFYKFKDVVQDITGMKHVVPTHQGRAAERILFSLVGGAGNFIVANTHFDTTRANVESSGAAAVDLVIAEGKDPQANHPFKGNIDLEQLSDFLAMHRGQVPMVLITVTNNSGGGQPVSLANMRAAREICDIHNVPLFLDCARFAENAWFIKMREEGQENRTPKEIAQDMFRLADGAWMSSKKDAFGNIGGFLAINDDTLAAECRNVLILTEGFPTYGGLAGRDLEALAIGLEEVLEENYLEYRIRSTEYVWESLDHFGVPLLRPAGGHAVYLDARQFLSHVKPEHFPGQSLSVAMFAEGGVRACEIGSVMFGRTLEDGSQEIGPMDLVRLAIPRRVYTQSHMDYVIEVVKYVYEKRKSIKGMQITEEPPALRHFTCSFAPIDWNPLVL
ncbi:MAG: tryptophanase [Planctomycetes bacterium]|nr:tryptophanase [Planctomycetota bacterium]